MDGPWVKGVFFHYIFKFLKKKLGQASIDKVGYSPEDYLEERAYPLSEFITLLERTDRLLDEYSEHSLHGAGRFMISVDPKWPQMFMGKDPGEVLTCNTRQDWMMNTGEYGFEKVTKSKEVILTCDLNFDSLRDVDLWMEYYRGCIHGVLDACGVDGDVETISLEGKPSSKKLSVTWE